MKGIFFNALVDRRDKLIEEWVKYALHTYPSKSASFFSKQSDPLLNPVGNILKKSLEDIFDELLKEQASQDLVYHVDAIVRIRAVQDFSPSGAVIIFWKIKELVEEVIDVESFEKQDREEVKEFFRRVDNLCFLAFDVFMKCREKLWELKTKEFQAGIRNILRLYDIKKENNKRQ